MRLVVKLYTTTEAFFHFLINVHASRDSRCQSSLAWSPSLSFSASSLLSRCTTSVAVRKKCIFGLPFLPVVSKQTVQSRLCCSSTFLYLSYNWTPDTTIEERRRLIRFR